MKKMKVLVAASLALVLTVGLAACGGGGASSDGDIMKTAQKELEKVKSMNCDMVMDMNMSVAGQTMETSTTGKISMMSEPMLMQMDMTMDGGAQGKYDMVMYAEQKDKDYVMYMSADNGTTWMKQTMTDVADLSQYDAQASMDMYLGSSEGFKEGATEKVNGSDAVRYDGVISKDAMNEVMASSGAEDQLSSLGITEEQAAEMYKDLGELPISVWIDKESSLPVKYEMDMTAVMQKLMGNMMEAMGEAAAGVEFKVDKMLISMTMSDFNKVSEIKIPDAAKNAQEVVM